MRLTNGQVASATVTPRARQAASTSGGTPWARRMSVSPGPSADGSSTAVTPRAASARSTCSLWMSRPQV